MKVIKNESNGKTLSVEQEELRAVLCSLGESMQVIESSAFEAQMGVAKSDVRRLIDEFDPVYRKWGRRKKLFLTNDELRTVRNALTASLEIEDWEFHLRMGFTKAEVRNILAEVGDLVPG